MITEKVKSNREKVLIILILFIITIISIVASVCLGTMKFTVLQSLRAIFVNDDSSARLIIWNIRLPRVLAGGLVGICLSLAGCILQGVMRNNLASPSTIGVTGGATFVGYLTLVAFPHLSYLLPIGSILGAFLTTMIIYAIAYQRGVSPVKMILSGLAVSAVFGAFNDIIKIFFSDTLQNATGFLVGSMNGVSWKNLFVILPYALVGIAVVFFLPTKMNILMLGDEIANTLGLRTELFRLLLIIVSSLLAGAAISVAGLIGFVGLIVPHIARLLVGSDYKYLFPTSIFLGASVLIICDTIGRIIFSGTEISVSIVMSFIGAPFFLYLLRSKENRGV